MPMPDQVVLEEGTSAWEHHEKETVLLQAGLYDVCDWVADERGSGWIVKPAELGDLSNFGVSEFEYVVDTDAPLAYVYKPEPSPAVEALKVTKFRIKFNDAVTYVEEAWDKADAAFALLQKAGMEDLLEDDPEYVLKGDREGEVIHLVGLANIRDQLELYHSMLNEVWEEYVKATKS